MFDTRPPIAASAVACAPFSSDPNLAWNSENCIVTGNLCGYGLTDCSLSPFTQPRRFSKYCRVRRETR
eukprot:798990-Prymnesium_polylepis.1